MSAMGTWRMAWGKLLGGPSYAWYGALLCAAVALASGILLGRTSRTLQTVLLCVLGVGALHCGLMASRLYGMDPARPAGNRSTWGLVIIVFFLVQMVGGLVVGLDGLLVTLETARWWGVPMAGSHLALFLAACTLLLGLLALWRAMSMQLSVPTTPWAWVLGNAAACALLLDLVPDTTARVLGPLLCWCSPPTMRQPRRIGWPSAGAACSTAPATANGDASGKACRCGQSAGAWHLRCCCPPMCCGMQTHWRHAMASAPWC